MWTVRAGVIASVGAWLALSGCKIGDTGQGDDGTADTTDTTDGADGTLVDAPLGPTIDAAPGTPDAPIDCDDPVNSGDDGHHNPGADCISAGCHAAGGGGPRFYVGGTVYTNAAGAAPLPDATIRVVDGNGVEHKLIAADNGNFWTTDNLPTPFTVAGSLCPDLVPMNGAVTNGSCNVGGCHSAAGGNGRIHVP